MASASDFTPFEGTEKLIELWFSPSFEPLPPAPPSSFDFPTRPPREGGEPWQGLRRVPREVWEDMLDIVKCKVLSFIEGEEVDAYLLSESSFFVFPNKLILKTCGTTLNLLGLPRILSIAKDYAGFDSVYRCFYSRKSFMFPEYQIGPYKGGWTAEVGFLDDIFDNGSAYTVGPMNGDHWLLYVTAPREIQTPCSSEPSTPLLSSLSNLLTPAPHHTHTSSGDHSSYASTSSVLKDALASAALHFPDSSSSVSTHGSATSGSNFPPAKNHTKVVDAGSEVVERPLRLPSLGTLHRGRGDDQTLEVLMTHLSARSRAQFYPPPLAADTLKAPEGDVLGNNISESSLLTSLFPASLTTLDSYGFDPCGYSANALVRSPPASDSLTSNLASSIASLTSTTSSVSSLDSSEGYWTVHVTPEQGYSYASFESNISLPSTSKDGFPDLKTLIGKVVDIFEPGRLTVTLFVSSADEGEDGAGEENGWGKGAKILDERGLLQGYRRRDRIGYEFEGYDLVFCCFEKIGWVEELPDKSKK
ncbi:S-adenosylmethionine decarboxylase [Mrakia frigida]|uniref:adenosylmethionine decarboxylase SPE2 n=1 Tax=Mrakia frigida TaxID=29902 RepID=UPI003FCC1E29